MQRLINDPDNVVDEMISGFVQCYAGMVELADNPRVVKRIGIPVDGKVGVVTGGGSGHKPAFLGYVGRNMVDAVAIGEVFSSPSAKAFYDAFKASDSGNGVACLYGNYAGDNMNVKMAMQLAAADGIVVKTVVANDDVASAPEAEREKRRGVAGEIFMWKVAGAKAFLEASLDEVIATAQRAIDNTRSVGVGLTPCTIPAVGKPNFLIEDGKMEFGIGHHGEPGVKVTDLMSADEVASQLLTMILADRPIAKGVNVAVLVSGLGATPVMELYIVYNKVCELLVEEGVLIHTAYVGNYFTSLDMMGVTLSVMQLDQELEYLLDMECESMGITQFAR